MSEILKIFAKMADQIEEWLAQGVSDEEIAKRLQNPGGVGRELIAGIKRRKGKFDDYVQNG